MSLLARFDRMLKERDDLVALLRELEWEGRRVTAGQPPLILEACCPMCHGLSTDGHQSHCRLRAALRG